MAAAALLVTAGPAPLASAAGPAPKQWYLDAMGAEAIRKVSTGKGNKIAVIGTGGEPRYALTARAGAAGKDALVADGLAKGSVTDTRDTTGAGTMARRAHRGNGPRRRAEAPRPGRVNR
ncbi:hypothetical protein [Streptomyces sp. NPDC007905]|uniref:hypothetical protein n=1 Tax=Streptomyces sp. NPDC007905 TaxID=3364788 RepID=UPI0036EBB08A